MSVSGVSGSYTAILSIDGEEVSREVRAVPDPGEIAAINVPMEIEQETGGLFSKATHAEITVRIEFEPPVSFMDG